MLLREGETVRTRLTAREVISGQGSPAWTRRPRRAVPQNGGVTEPGPLGRALGGGAHDDDQSGVAFFRPIAARLVDLLAPQPGEHALDVGCGRAAVTVPLARAVTPAGGVTAVDLSPATVALTRQVVAAAGLPHVRVEQVERLDDLALLGTHDVVASSLAVMFLPDPLGAVTGWVDRLRPGGRIGLSTFGEADRVFDAVSELFAPFQPPGVVPAVPREVDVFLSDESVEGLVAEAGAVDVTTVRQTLEVRFLDAERWRAWTMTTGQRIFWGRMSPGQRHRVMTRAAELLEPARGPDGIITLRQEVRHTLGRRPTS